MNQETTYLRAWELREGGLPVSGRAKEAIRREVAAGVLAEWRELMSGPLYRDQKVVRAILPILGEWVGRSGGQLTFRAAQVLTGHGCFGRYLYRIGREASPRCHHCEDGQDSAQHTLETCRAWEVQRRALNDVIGEDPRER